MGFRQRSVTPPEAQKKLLKDGFAILCDVVPKDIIYDLYNAYESNKTFTLREAAPMKGKAYEPSSLDWFLTEPAFKRASNFFLNFFQKKYNLRTMPTYNMGRIYTNETTGMIRHTDRVPCEISISMPVAYDLEPWRLHVKGKNGQEVGASLMVGDVLVYMGCDCEHWREDDNTNKKQIQHYFHYVNLDSELGSFYRYFGKNADDGMGYWKGDLLKMKKVNDLPIVDEEVKIRYLKSIGEEYVSTN